MKSLPVLTLTLFCICLNEVTSNKILPGEEHRQLVQLTEESTNNDRILKRSTLQDAYESHLAMLMEAEQSLTKQIEELKLRREELSNRKRSHVMCLVNLISCFRKR